MKAYLKSRIIVGIAGPSELRQKDERHKHFVPITEDPGSSPIIGNFYWTYLLLTGSEKDENKEKEAVNGPFKKIFPLNIQMASSKNCLAHM